MYVPERYQGGVEFLYNFANRYRGLQEDGLITQSDLPSESTFFNELCDAFEPLKGRLLQINATEQYADWDDRMIRERCRLNSTTSRFVCCAVVTCELSDYQELAVVTYHMQDRPAYIPRTGQLITPILLSQISVVF